jgi:DNA-binding NtrC family response regulator
MDRILIVEDREGMRNMLITTFENEGYEVVSARDGREGIQILQRESFHAVITDLKLPFKDGIEVLKVAREVDSQMVVIIMTAYGTVEKAVQAVKEGAHDFITKPFDSDHLITILKRGIQSNRILSENILLHEMLSDRIGAPTIIGKSKKLQEISAAIRKVSASDATVLLMGESGTGKELFARAIHHLSGRNRLPFVAINCAAIPHNLLENELFGHDKGAFTGAGERKQGKFELADGGTVFLDEIGDLSPLLQAKLLRVLQEKEFERVGGSKTIRVDIRLVAATNKDLQLAIKNREFREDLYFRLMVVPITIPPLREHKEDIPLIADHFIQKFSRDLKVKPKKLTAQAMEFLINYSWPGNVRELENCIERALILAESEEITPRNLNLDFASKTDAVISEILPLEGKLSEVTQRAVSAIEKSMINDAMRLSNNNKSRAAEFLGISYKSLLNKLKDYSSNSSNH